MTHRAEKIDSYQRRTQKERKKTGVAIAERTVFFYQYGPPLQNNST